MTTTCKNSHSVAVSPNMTQRNPCLHGGDISHRSFGAVVPCPFCSPSFEHLKGGPESGVTEDTVLHKGAGKCAGMSQKLLLTPHILPFFSQSKSHGQIQVKRTHFTHQNNSRGCDRKILVQRSEELGPVHVLQPH